LCLIIYELADYRNSADIRATWVNLIHSLEVEATKTQQAQAFELVAEKFRDMGKRLNCSETTFPIREFSFITTRWRNKTINASSAVLLPILLEWAIIDAQTSQRPGLEIWPIELFLDLSVPYEVLVTGLEDLFYSPEAPWRTDRNKAKVAQLLVYTIDKWYGASIQGGGIVFGSEENAAAMLEMLKTVTGWGKLDRRAQDEVERVRDLVDRVLW
jgi:nuclear pore complex protein Nup155